MKIDLKVLQELAPTFGVAPIKLVKGAQQLIQSGQTSKAPDHLDGILSNANYEYSMIGNFYEIVGQKLYYYQPQDIFLWVLEDTLARVISGNDGTALKKWVLGDEKYPHGKANKFLEVYGQMTGESAPTGDEWRGQGGGDIEVQGGGSRLGDYEPKQVDPTDALIAKLKKLAKNGNLPSDVMIDVGVKAKKDGNQKLLQFLSTMKPKNEIKQSMLEDLIRNIVKTLVKEAWDQPYNHSEDGEAVNIAKKLWGNETKFNRKKASPEGVVFQFYTADNPRSKFLWKTPQGIWKYNDQTDPKNKKWNDVEPKQPGLGADDTHLKEMSACAAAGPTSQPVMVNKRKIREGTAKKDEEEPLEEMTTTGAVDGYNVPGAFSGRKGGSVKGVAGSAKLGYTLTKTGEKDMSRKGDNLL